MGILTKLFGTYSEGQIKKIMSKVTAVEELADTYRAVTADIPATPFIELDF